MQLDAGLLLQVADDPEQVASLWIAARAEHADQALDLRGGIVTAAHRYREELIPNAHCVTDPLRGGPVVAAVSLRSPRLLLPARRSAPPASLGT